MGKVTCPDSRLPGQLTVGIAPRSLERHSRKLTGQAQPDGRQPGTLSCYRWGRGDTDRKEWLPSCSWSFWEVSSLQLLIERSMSTGMSAPRLRPHFMPEPRRWIRLFDTPLLVGSPQQPTRPAPRRQFGSGARHLNDVFRTQLLGVIVVAGRLDTQGLWWYNPILR